MNGVHVHMPRLRTMLDEAPDELVHYVRAFVSAKIDDPVRVERWVDRVIRSIDATRPRDPWERNLRELSHHVDRFLLGQVPASRPQVTVEVISLAPVAAPVETPTPEAPEAPAPAPPAAAAAPAAPESTCLPSSGLLGPKVKAGEATMEELHRAAVTRVHVLTGENIAETARRLDVDRRTVTRWLDPGRLERWRKDPK